MRASFTRGFMRSPSSLALPLQELAFTSEDNRDMSVHKRVVNTTDGILSGSNWRSLSLLIKSLYRSDAYGGKLRCCSQLTILLESRRSNVSCCDRLPHTFLRLRLRYLPLTEKISPEPRYLTPGFLLWSGIAATLN